jgi:predicted RNA-binding protein YlxR (DUF448 family)
MSQNNPERTCVVCRSKKSKDELFRFAEKKGKFVFDKNMDVQARGAYVCKDANCINRLSKHKKYNISIEELGKMMAALKKEKKDYLNILSAMKSSDYLVFGIKMIFEEIDKIHFVIIADDISEKNDVKLIRILDEKKINYAYFSDKQKLGAIFSKKEVNAVGIKSKKVARGLL